MLLLPKSLPVSGGTIGVIGLSSPCNPQMFQDGLAQLTAYGFKTKVPFDPTVAYKKTVHLFASETPEKRLAGFKELLQDPEVSAIFLARGGYGMVELLDRLDFEAIAVWQKPIVGISDATVFLNYLRQRTGLVCFHGPAVAGGFSRAKTLPPQQEACEALVSLLRGEPQNPFAGTALQHLQGKTEAKGRLCGGNLSILASAVGTPYEIDFDDKIVIIEEVGEELYRVHRMLTQLKSAGKFTRASAVIVGEFLKCGNPQTARATVEELFLNVLQDEGTPLFRGLPVGHGDQNLPFPIGILAEIQNNKLEFLEAAVLR